MRSNLSGIAVAALVGALASAAALRAPLARAQDPGFKHGSPAFTYHPRGVDGTPQLLDTRTGAIYKRNNSGGWDLDVKPLIKD